MKKLYPSPSHSTAETGEYAKSLLISDTYKQFNIGKGENRTRYCKSISVLELVDEFSSLSSLSIETDDAEDATARVSLLKIYVVLHPDSLLIGSNEDGTNMT